MRIICLDAEFADNEEILELSVFSSTGEELYHRYFCPENIEDWRTDIHHITPGMVAGLPSFEKCRVEVQSIMDSADGVTGFAVNNDFRVLERAGITGLDHKEILDVKEMFWYLRGKEKDMSPYNVPSLLACSQSLGLDFSSDDAHSAKADTVATLDCYRFLMKEYCDERGVDLEEGFQIFRKSVSEAMAEYVERSASGYVKVYKSGPYYKLKFTRVEDAEKSQLVLEMPVKDRFKAEYELRKMLKKKEVPDKIHLYKLSSKQIEEIRRYKNEYEAEESAWCKKVIKNLGRLSL